MINQHQTLQVGRSYQDTVGYCFGGQLNCKVLANLLKIVVLIQTLFFFAITWVSFDQSTSKFAGGCVISRHKLGLILGSIGLYNPCQLAKTKTFKIYLNALVVATC